MNHLIDIKKLKNNYFIMRHGESEANVLEILAFDPIKAVKGYGLSESGKVQVKESISKNKSFDAGTIIISSPFKRTKETAEIVSEFLGGNEINYSDKIRERSFGEYDLTGYENYFLTIKRDAENPDQKMGGVESINEVLDRTTSLILDLEEKFKDKTILLISHGDPSLILQSAFERLESTKFSELPYQGKAEIRKLELV